MAARCKRRGIMKLPRIMPGNFKACGILNLTLHFRQFVMHGPMAPSTLHWKNLNKVFSYGKRIKWFCVHVGIWKRNNWMVIHDYRDVITFKKLRFQNVFRPHSKRNTDVSKFLQFKGRFGMAFLRRPAPYRWCQSSGKKSFAFRCWWFRDFWDVKEIAKIYCRLREYFKDYKSLSQVQSETHCLDTQWKQYAHVKCKNVKKNVYYDLIQLLTDNGFEKTHEENRHGAHKKNLLWLQQVNRSTHDWLQRRGYEGNVADDNSMELT